MVYLKAEALWSISEYAEAASTYKKMISFSGDDLLKVGAYVFLGMLYDKAEMPVQAKDQYTSAISFWENGYVPHKQFREYEESEYILALAMLEEKDKIKKIVSDAKEYRYQRYLEWLFKTPKELLDLHFKEYTLPDNIKPLEE